MCTTCSPQYTADELARQLNDAGAAYLITFSQFLEKVCLVSRVVSCRVSNVTSLMKCRPRPQ